MVIDPATDDGVQFTNQQVLRGALVGFYNLADFLQKRFCRGLRRLYEQLPVVLPDVLLTRWPSLSI